MPLNDSDSPSQAGLGGWVQCLSTAFDSGLILLDEKGEVSLINRVAERLLGRDLAILRRDWPALRREIDRQADVVLWDTGGEADVVLPKLDDDPSPHRYQLRVVSVNVEDCRGHLIQVQDLLAVRAIEQDRVLANQMRSISHLYRSMAHDLRSPLNAMVVNLELLGDAVASGASGDDLEARRQRYVRVLKQEMDRLNQRLLGFLSQTAPARSDQQREFDLVPMIREMVLFVEPQASKQKADLEMRLPEEPLRVHGNPDTLRQTLLALTVNALAALEGEEREGGGRIEIGAQGVGDDIVLWVADDGPGIPDEIVDHVFDLHFTTKEDGSGIGLHVAREAIESHGGELSLVRRDEPGAGTLFQIRLPARSENHSKESST